MPFITSKICSGFVLSREGVELSGLLVAVLFDGRDLVSEGRGRDLGGRDEGLEEQDLDGEDLEEEGLDDSPKEVDGTSFVLSRENPGIWSNEG